MSHYQASDLNAKSVLEIVSRHKKKIVIWPLLSLALGAAYFLFFPRTYLSEARLFLRVGRETVGIDPSGTAGQTMPMYTADRENEVKSAEEVFKSRSVAAQVVDRLGADIVLGHGGSDSGSTNRFASAVAKPIGALREWINSVDPISERESAIINVERNLTVMSERQATVIVVQYTASSPQLAQTVCQAVVEVAQQEHMRVHRDEGSTPFFTEQQQRLRQQLEQSLEALRKAKDEMGLASVEQRRESLEAQYSAIELDRLSTNQQLATAQARIEDLQRQLTKVPERLIASKRSVPNESADMLRTQLYELQVKAMDIKARYSDTHPLVVAVNDQLNEAKKVLDEQPAERTETTDDINTIHRSLALSMKQEQSVVAGLGARLGELDQQNTAVLAELRTVNGHDLTIDQLTRDADLARDKYMQYARIMEEARIDNELQNSRISNISVPQAATLAEKPVSPSKMLTALGTILLAAGGTLGLVLLSERQNWTAPPVIHTQTMARRMPRRRVRREFVSKTNGQSETDDMRSPPK